MQCVRRHHVDDVDVLVGGHAIHGRVVVHALVRDAVLLLPLLGLGRGAGDDAGETAIARLLQRGRDLVGREAAEPDECDAELARRCFGRRCLAREAGQQRCGGEGGGGGEEFAALVTHVTSLKAVADIPARESSRARAPLFQCRGTGLRPGVTHACRGYIPGRFGMSVGSNNFLAAKGILLTMLVLALAACTAGNGEGLDSNGQPNPINPPAASDFQQIQDTIFTPICTACHIGANAPQGMRLDAANSYAMIVGVPSNEVPGLMRINPGNPDASYLVQKIQGNAAQGVRMPANGPPYLTQEQIDLVRRWVAAGAPPAAVAPNNLTVTSVIPAAGEVAPAGLAKLTVVFARDVDASLVSSTFEV